MKTAEECLDILVDINLKVNTKHRPLSSREQDNHVNLLKEMFKNIQLDAIKEGMRRAAEETDKMVEIGDGMCPRTKHPAEIKDAILTAAEQLIEKDLV